MRNTIVLLGLSLATCLTLPASTLIYNFSSPSGNLGSSDHTYTSNGLSIPAYGFSSSSPLSLGTGVNLFGKTDGAHETGLGLVNDLSGDHEIVPGSYIQLDLSGLTHATGFGIQVLSVQQGEGYNLYLSNAKGVAGATYQTGISSESAYTVPVADIQITPFLSISASSGNVLLGSATATTQAPEPTTMFSMGMGLLAVAFFIRRKQSMRSLAVAAK